MEVYFLLYLLFACNGLIIETWALCGTFCTCETPNPNDLLVKCTGENITEVPSRLPANTTKL